ncbi:hypothetical protein [Tistrella sp.]|nr:hypothetical protein [Tistrella sp.]|tara:strand:+ start:1362 stop:2534 length:1173 start_codon:yes stop_codon:yes gene_type:complete
MMEKQMRNLACGVAAMALIFNVSAAAAQDCVSLSGDVADRIAEMRQIAQSVPPGTQSDYAAATSKDYAEGVFSAFDALNKKVTETSKLVGQGYNLAGYTAVFKEGQIQTKMPPVVTNTMSNAEALAQAAADDDKTKLDILSLRCSQSTEQTALAAYLAQADSGTASAYKTAKFDACKAIHILADLQDKRQKLNDIRENGYPLFYLHAKEKKKFAGYSRTFQLKVDLRMFPVYPDKAMKVDGKDQPVLLGQIQGIDLSYNSYFKWSDDNWSPLNLYQYVISDTRKDDYTCAPYFHLSGHVETTLCVKVESASADKLKVGAKAKFKYKGDTKEVSLGTQTVPAPFGYLADLSDMKEKKMQDLQSKVVDRIASVFNVYDALSDKATSWQKACK